jgi:hypothetical protein
MEARLPASGTTALVPVSRFIEELSIDRSTVWRWQKKNWLPASINIAGRSYLLATAVADFLERAKRGEFKGGPTPPKRKQASAVTPAGNLPSGCGSGVGIN